MARITAAEASQIIREEQRQLNNGRRLPHTLNRIRVLMAEEFVIICNVGPWEHRRELGCKNFFIPAYDPKADPQKLRYAKSDPIPGVCREAYIATDEQYGYYEDDGMQVAQEAIGIGFGISPMNSLVRFGVFVPAGKEPTQEELQAAREQLSKYYDFLIEEARDAFDKGPEERKAVISDRHLFAARIRGIDEKWVHHQHTQESVRCEMCGKYNPAGVAKCACGTILDFELYTRIQQKQDQMLEAATRPHPVQPPVKR